MYKKILTLVLICSFVFTQASGQSNSLNPNKVTYPSYSAAHRTNFVFPKVGEYVVLTADLHTHTIFSDGLVWPTLRIAEAWAGGLDAVSITDHIEYRPFRNYTNNDHNTSYDIAKPDADRAGLLLIKGTEITRTQSTIGHYNAIFIKDANKIAVEDAKASIQEARNQGGFIIWNHPGWAVDTTVIKDFQENLFDEGLIDGIEVFNNTEFYPRTLAWAIDKNLTIIAASDVHGNVESGVLKEQGTERPMTLVLSKEKSLEGIREALDNGRTIAYFQNMLAAREDIAKEFVSACVTLRVAHKDNKTIWLVMENRGSAPFRVKTNNTEHYLPGLSSIIVTTPVSETNYLRVNFTNFYIYEDKTLAHDLYFN